MTNEIDFKILNGNFDGLRLQPLNGCQNLLLRMRAVLICGLGADAAGKLGNPVQ
jgi:hypothetical protein